MKNRKLYLAMFLIGIICAVYFIYNEKAFDSPVSAVAPAQEVYTFPAPENTIYQMGLYLDINTSTLYGSSVINTVNTAGKPLDELWFTIYPEAFRSADETPAPASAYYKGFNPGWLEIEQLTVNCQEVEYFKQGVALQVALPVDIMPHEDIKIEIKWQAQIPQLAYRYGFKDNVYMLGNFYPILNVLDEQGWHTSYNSVFGDPFCFNCADYLVRLNVPEAYQVVSTGMNRATIAEDNGRQTQLIEASNVRDFCLVVMYDYSQIEQIKNQTAIRCYAPREKAKVTEEILHQAGEILNYYACTFGSYGYPEFKVVFVPMKGFHGMEYSGLIFLREEFLDSASEKERSQFILAHEIAHQWWYVMVGNDQLKEPWLDEGLANWCAYKYLAKYCDRPPPQDRELVTDVNLARELSDIYSTREYYLTAYSGGEAFWFGLEKELGEERVEKVLRRYLADYRFKIATSQDLLDTIKKEANQDLEPYFSRWFKP